MLVWSSRRTGLPPGAAAGAVQRAAAADLAADLSTLVSAESEAPVAPAATRALARLLLADVCVVLEPGPDHDSANVIHGFDLVHKRSIESRVLPLAGMPALASALQRGKSVRLSSEQHAPDLSALAQALGLSESGPAIIAPLETGGRHAGSVLVMSSYSKYDWTPDDQRALTSLAAATASALTRRQTLADGSRQLSEALTNLDTTSRQLLESRSAVDRLSEHAQQLQAELTEAQRQADAADDLRADLGEAQAAAAEADDLRRELAEQSALIERLHAPRPEGQPEGPDPEHFRYLEGELRHTLQDNARLVSQLGEIQARSAGLQLAPGAAAHAPLPDTQAIASLSLRLRHPTASILGYTELLLSETVGILGATQRKFMERIKASVVRLESLLDDLTRTVTAGQGPAGRQDRGADLMDVVDEAVAGAGLRLRAKRLALHLDIGDDLPRIHADRDALAHALTQLLNHAATASRPNGDVIIAAHPQVDGDAPADYLLVSVTDFGAGMAPDERARIFGQPASEVQDGLGGPGDTGAALSSAKSVIEAQGGRIWIEGEAGQSSTFKLLLPTHPLGEAEVPASVG